MNLYEHTIVARQDTSPAQVKSLAEKYTKIVEKNDGEIVQTEDWGLLNLAYTIKKNKKGIYMHFKIKGAGKIIKELEKPGVDPRAKAKVFSFDASIKTIADLKIGQMVPGIVNNITNFGCFVDIGTKESGLIHVSNLSDTFVKDINSIVTLQQQIIVKVLEVDVVRKRIQLALIK